jgi:hypothetical protein
MKKKDALEPERYWPRASDPGYRGDLIAYLDDQDIRHTRWHPEWERDRERDWIETSDRITRLYEQIRAGASYQPFCLPSQQAINCVIEAIKLFGLGALVPPVWKRSFALGLSPRARKERLRWYFRHKWLAEAVYKLIEGLRILTGSEVYGAKAKKQLERIMKTFIPDGRGRLKKGMRRHPYTVRLYYYEELFRLYHIRHFLRQPGQLRSEKVREASRRFDMPIEQIREFWGLDEEDNLDRQPFTLKDMARELTARRFRISQQTVANLLAKHL